MKCDRTWGGLEQRAPPYGLSSRRKRAVSIRNLDKIFAPRRIAVIGAGDAPAGPGSAVLRNLLAAGFRGDLYPVNPRGEPAAGIAGYPDLASLPETPDLAVVCTPAAAVPAVVRACGEAGVRGAIVLTPGFRESGPQGRKLEERLRDEQRRFDGLRILGPNCLGLIVPSRALNVSLATAMPPAGHVGFISQSAAMQTSVLDWAIQRGVGFSAFVSAGNTLDIGIADLIDYFGSATETRSLILAVESVGPARQFMSAARTSPATSRSSPTRPTASTRFAKPLSSAAGIEPVAEIDELYDCGELLARQHARKGGRAAGSGAEPAACQTPEKTARRRTPGPLRTQHGTLAPDAAGRLARARFPAPARAAGPGRRRRNPPRRTGAILAGGL